MLSYDNFSFKGMKRWVAIIFKQYLNRLLLMTSICTGSVFIDHSQTCFVSLFPPPPPCKFECNTTSDWLNRMV